MEPDKRKKLGEQKSAWPWSNRPFLLPLPLIQRYVVGKIFKVILSMAQISHTQFILETVSPYTNHCSSRVSEVQRKEPRASDFSLVLDLIWPQLTVWHRTNHCPCVCLILFQCERRRSKTSKSVVLGSHSLYHPRVYMTQGYGLLWLFHKQIL